VAIGRAAGFDATDLDRGRQRVRNSSPAGDPAGLTAAVAGLAGEAPRS
jgi:hypothetical protein